MIINKLKELKEKIMIGATAERDIDVINEAIDCIKELTALSAMVTEIPSQEDFSIGTPNGINVAIENLTINVWGMKGNDPPTPDKNPV